MTVRTIRLRFCELDLGPWGACTRFPDGARFGAEPHDTPEYHAVAHLCGYEGDILRYCQEHELSHALIGEAFNSHSLVLWALAHGEEPTRMVAAAEESLTLHLQRYVRTSINPFVAGVDWTALKARFLEVMPC